MSKEALETYRGDWTAGPSAVHRIGGLLRRAIAGLSRAARASEQRLSIEERLVIGPKKTLMLVNCDGRRFLLATAGDMIAPMIELSPSGNADLDDPTAISASRKGGGV
jgi:flagellar biogenesis protein FliO